MTNGAEEANSTHLPQWRGLARRGNEDGLETQAKCQVPYNP